MLGPLLWPLAKKVFGIDKYLLYINNKKRRNLLVKRRRRPTFTKIWSCVVFHLNEFMQLDQCDQIWRNFAILANKLKYLVIF